MSEPQSLVHGDKPGRGESEPRGESLDGVRRRNLSLVLGLVHRDGAHSRAWLTKQTGLNRSTVSALVSELVQLGLVEGSEPDPSGQVGRPSLVIRASSTTTVVTVNPELDAVTIGLVSLGGRVLRHRRVDTESVPTATEVVDLVVRQIAELRDEFGDSYRIVGIGVAVPGLVRDDDGQVTLGPHLGWHGEPIARMLRSATGIPVVAANDANAGAVAETTFGAAKGVRDVVYLNGGASGIGAGIVSGGELLRGASGYAGELGHLMVNGAGIRCRCGSSGCLETEVTRQPLLDALGLDVSRSEQLERELVLAYATEGPSPELAAVVDRQLGFLGLALGSTANIFNPRLIVLGGFLGALYRVAPERLESAVRRETIPGPREDVALAVAELGGDILLIGAAELAFADLLAHPAG